MRRSENKLHIAFDEIFDKVLNWLRLQLVSEQLVSCTLPLPLPLPAFSSVDGYMMRMHVY